MLNKKKLFSQVMIAIILGAVVFIAYRLMTGQVSTVSLLFHLWLFPVVGLIGVALCGIYYIGKEIVQIYKQRKAYK